MPTEEIGLTFNVKADMNPLREELRQAIANGDIHMALKAGSDDWVVRPASFTIDKRKYSLRLSDETEDSVKVWIEPK